MVRFFVFCYFGVYLHCNNKNKWTLNKKVMANNFIQCVFYHYILSDISIVSKFEAKFFGTKPLQLAFGIAKDYVLKYHESPSSEQMKQLSRIANINEDLTDDLIDVIYSQKSMLSSYTDEWLYDQVTNWAILENVTKSIEDAAYYLQMNKDNVEDGDAKLMVEHIKSMFNRSCVLDFSNSDNTGSDFWDAESHKQKKLVRSTSGYDFIDFCLNGGYFPGCLACFVGAPKSGKSLWMQNLCAESVKKGEDCVYITLELPEEMVTARIGSNMFSIPSLEYNTHTQDTTLFKEKINNFKKSCLVKPGELLVKEYPTSTLTVIELEAFLLQEEEKRSVDGKKFKFKNIFIDYLNIMRNYRNPNSENTYMKIKQLAEDVKAMGTKNGWAIITATQTNRSQFDSNDISASQVSESSALGATVDIMFGIIADPMMKAQGYYYLKCIYDRVSPQENKKKLFNCNFNYLRITEDVNEGIIDASVVTFSNPPRQENKSNNGNVTFEPGTPQKPDDSFQVKSFEFTQQEHVPGTINANQMTSPSFTYTGKGMF